MGQAHVKRWIDDILPLVTDDDDPLGTEDFATHKLPLTEAPGAYETFQKKEDDAIKIVFEPTARRPLQATAKRCQTPVVSRLLGRGFQWILGQRLRDADEVLGAALAVLWDQSWPSSVSRYSSPGPGPLFQ